MRKLVIVKGSTFADTLRWATSECVLIQGSLNPSVPVTIESVGHNIPDGWMVSIDDHPMIPESARFQVKAIDSNTIGIPCMNGAKFNRPRAVVVRLNKPVDLSGYTAKMQIRDLSGNLLIELSTENGRITIDNADKTIERSITAADTSALTAERATYDLEMIQGAYVVKIDSGTIEIVNEVTA